MAVNFVIMPGAKEFIMERGGSAFISLKPHLTSAGCGTPHITTVPAVVIGNPPAEESGNYNVTTINEVKVYVHDSLFGHDGQTTLKIDMENTLFDRRLTIGGFSESSCNSCNNFGSSCSVEKI